MRFIILPFVIFISSIYSFGQTYTGDPEEISNIVKSAKNFSQHIVNADYEKIGDAYTADAKIFPNNTKIIEGREQIIQYWELPEGVRTIAHKTMASEIKIIGDEAYDYGYYEGTTRRANGEEVSWKGKYVIVWKKVEGEWKMYLDIWNRVAD